MHCLFRTGNGRPTASVVETEIEATLIIFGISGVVQVAFACGINNAAVPRISKKALFNQLHNI
jgi:hypothetical protein